MQNADQERGQGGGMNNDLQLVQTALAEIDLVSAGISELKKRYAGMVYDVTTAEGMAEATAARKAINSPIIKVEKIRKDGKAPILELGRKLDGEAKRITAELDAIKRPIELQIDMQKAKEEQAAQVERERIAAITETIAGLHRVPSEMGGKSSAEIAKRIAALQEHDLSEWADEFIVDAEKARAGAIAALQQLHAGAVAQEQTAVVEKARIEQERTELAKLREEQAERDRLAELHKRQQEEAEATTRAKIALAEKESRERIEAEERAARLAREEADRIARQAREAEEAKAKAIRDEEERKLKAERDRVEAERREIEEAARKEREAAEAKARVERQAEEEKQRKIRLEMQATEDAQSALQNFKSTYGSRQEFAGIVAAIDAYFVELRKAA